MAYDLSDYIDVAERLTEARDKWPDGRLTSRIIDLPEAFADKFVAVEALFWRTHDDPNPAVGLAWEPVPGKTPYTRDSELMNAETSAWGRALVAALQADTKRGVASANEVRNRQGSGGGVSVGSQSSPTRGGPASSATPPPDVYLIEKLGVEDDGRWPQVCPACTAEVEQAQTRAGKDMWKCTNRDCEGGAADRLRDDGRRWWWTSFHEDPWKPGGEIDNLVRSAGGGTVENVTPDIDPERWLADAVEAFDQWTPEQRHEYGTQAMHELTLTRPLSKDDAAMMLRQMRAWYDAEFADDDERPF